MKDINFTSTEIQSILFQDWDLGDVQIEAEVWTFDDGVFIEDLLTRHALLDFGVLFDNLSATGVALAAESGAEHSTRFLSRGTVFNVTSDPVRKLTTVSIEMDDTFSTWPRTTSLRDALAARRSSK